MSFLSYSKDFQGIGDIFLRDPVRYLPFVQLLDSVMSRESELSKTQKEMMALYSSRLNGCHYCVRSHSSVLTNLKTEDELVRSLANNSTDLLDDKLRAAFKFANKLTLKPKTISEIDIDAMRSAGWSDQGIEETICVVSTFAFLNRIIDGFGIMGSDDHIQQVGALIAQKGYQPLVNMIQKKASDSLKEA
ncbi:carboxymuconolactone decarboxylase family protein [Agaribacterium sp. ZY112]|uniref:carboxymuconolactone decarboxylase family protein n=1 Tax=Agaribacterium sp. ZY112 TaxID=3233574 RepID=UPI00352540FC